MSEENRINIMEETPSPVLAQTTQQPAVEYASITERFVALAIDYGIIFLPLKGLSWLICKWLGPTLEMWQLIGMAVAINAVFILYETVFSSNGRVTLGKNLVGIAVVKKDLSGPISLPRAFMRAVGYYVSAFLFFGGFVLAFVDDRKRTLHDIFGGSATNISLMASKDLNNCHVITGLNLSMLLTAINSRKKLNAKELAEKIESDGKRAVINATELLIKGL